MSLPDRFGWELALAGPGIAYGLVHVVGYRREGSAWRVNARNHCRDFRRQADAKAYCEAYVRRWEARLRNEIVLCSAHYMQPFPAAAPIQTNPTR